MGRTIAVIVILMISLSGFAQINNLTTSIRSDKSSAKHPTILALSPEPEFIALAIIIKY